MGKKTLFVQFDDVSHYWTGLGWLVVEDDGEPPVASFATKEEAEAEVVRLQSLE